MKLVKFIGALTVISVAVSGCAQDSSSEDPASDGVSDEVLDSDADEADGENVGTTTQELTAASCRTSASQAHRRCESLLIRQCFVTNPPSSRPRDTCLLYSGISAATACDAAFAAAQQSCNAGKVRLALYTYSSGSRQLNYESMVGASTVWSTRAVVHLRQTAGTSTLGRQTIYHCQYGQSGNANIGETDFLTKSSNCDGRGSTPINMGFSWDSSTSGVRALYKCRRNSTIGAGTWTDEFMNFDARCGGTGTRIGGVFAYVKNGG